MGKSGGDLGGKVRAVWAVLRVPGSFAALRMTAKTNNGKDENRQWREQRQQQETGNGRGDRGGKVRAVSAVPRVPGSFAALRMTAKTKARTSNGKGRSRSPSGMTGKKSSARMTSNRKQTTVPTALT